MHIVFVFGTTTLHTASPKAELTTAQMSSSAIPFFNLFGISPNALTIGRDLTTRETKDSTHTCEDYFFFLIL